MGKANTNDNGPTDALSDHLADSYDRLRRIASRLLASEQPGHTLQATALVNEAWLRLEGGDIDCRDRAHAIALATRQMRHALVDHARQKKAKKRPGSHLRVDLDAALVAQPVGTADGAHDMLDLLSALTELEQSHRRQAAAFEVRELGGLTVAECARYLGISERAVRYHCTFAKAWLLKRLDGDRRRPASNPS
ncbi:MAG: ECF-type sigma factor [Pseudomonadota bacterium]